MLTINKQNKNQKKQSKTENKNDPNYPGSITKKWWLNTTKTADYRWPGEQNWQREIQNTEETITEN